VENLVVKVKYNDPENVIISNIYLASSEGKYPVCYRVFDKISGMSGTITDYNPQLKTIVLEYSK